MQISRTAAMPRLLLLALLLAGLAVAAGARAQDDLGEFGELGEEAGRDALALLREIDGGMEAAERMPDAVRPGGGD